MIARRFLLFGGCLLFNRSISQSISQNAVKNDAVARTLDEMQTMAMSQSGFGSIGILHTKEPTEGSEFLFANWPMGSVTGNDGAVYDFVSINYDKLTREVLIAVDTQKIILDKWKFKAFRLESPGSSPVVFRRIDQIERDVFFKELVYGSHYSLYDNLKTTFKKSDYQSDGLTESGDKFDRFIDKHNYFIGNSEKQTYDQIKVSRKFLKNRFKENQAAQQFLAQHNTEPVTEEFIEKFVEAMDRQ